MKIIARFHLPILLFLLFVIAWPRPGFPAPAAGSDDPAPATFRRFALVAGANNGGPQRVLLHYAQSDARAVARVLGDLGGIAPDDIIVLLEPGPDALETAFLRMKTLISEARARGFRTELFFYFSGHSDEEGLLLNNRHFNYPEIRQILSTMPADVRIAVLDSCASGALTRGKGGKWQAPILADTSTQVRGHAFLTSASSDETAQESDRVGGSFFTHYLVSGLRGAADESRDGRITLNEAYQYAFNETLARTELTQPGPQHPNYDIQLAGSGELVITDLHSASAILVLAPGLEGRLFIRDADGRLVAEINKPSGRSMNLGLEPGVYRVSLERDNQLRQGTVTLTEGQETRLDRDSLEKVEPEAVSARGGKPVEPFSLPAPPDKEVTIRPVSFSFIPGLSTNYGASIKYRVKNYFSINLLLDWGDILSGAELSGIGAWRSQDVNGVQLAGVFNYAGGYLKGSQGSGIANIALGPVLAFQFSGVANHAGSLVGGVQATGIINTSLRTIRGGQFAGIVNYTGGHAEGLCQEAGILNWAESFHGIQISGHTNVSLGPVQGTQIAGVINYAGSITGVQAGVINVSPGEVHGLQLSVINYGGKVHGSQIGVINVAQEIDGASIGIINYAGNGILEPTIWGSDFSPLNIGLKMGSRHVYGLLGFGVHPFGKQEYSQTIFGLGGHFEAKPVWVDIDLAHHQLYGDYVYDDKLDFIDSLRISVGYRVLDQLSLYAGPTFNFLCSELRDDAGLGLNFWSRTDGDRNLRFFPGFVLGLQYEPRWGKLNVH
ncbi:MAG: caspase family protein [Proteobacteria bacterium]|nr:caspase family protein [Pseudomonadota bacterium]